MRDARFRPLIDLCDRDRGITYGIVKVGDFVPGGVPVIRGGDIRGGRVVFDGEKRVSPEVSRQFRRTILQGGELVINLIAEPGHTAIVPESLAGANVSRDVAVIALGDSVNHRFVDYYLKSKPAIDWLTARLQGSVTQKINLSTLRDLPIPVPSPFVQAQLVEILGALDDKIELNRRMSETLEAMARALFKSWVVDLDPMRAKASALIRDGVLEIGDGYRAKNDELGSDGLPFIRAADLNNGFNTEGADRLRWDRVERAGNKTSRVGDVAFTSKGTIGRFARVSELTEQFVYSPQVCYWRSLDADRMHPAILYCWMQSDELRSQIMAVAGQTDMAPYVSLKDQREMLVPVFPSSQRAFGERLTSFLTRISVAQGESRTLAALRDTLLPKLISGELRVPAAERLVAQAV